jgi:hypothetical protein
MTYKKNTVWDRPLPRIFGILVLIASIGTIFWLSRNVVLFGTKAALGNTPKNMQVSNITDSSFTVSYVTDETVTGSLNYGQKSQLGEIAFDSRDAKSPSPHKIHFINVSGLNPETKYFFSLTSGAGNFQNGTIPFETTTAKTTPEASSSAQAADGSIRGKIVLNSGAPPEEAIVYVESEESQTISALLDSDGNFEIKFKKLLSKDLTQQADIAPGTKFELRATDGTLESNISFLLSQADPLPLITLSKNYDFTKSPDPLSFTTATESAQTTPFPVPSDAVDAVPAILTPKIDEEFKDQQPLFRGTAAPESDVEVVIESSHQIIATVQADENGLWEYRPDIKLEPGDHTITVSAFNPQGIIQTIERSFTVFAEGSQFTEPSISPPAPTPTVTQAPSPTAGPTATSAPSATIAPTATPEISPTAVVVLPTSEVTTQPSPTSQITVPPIPDVGGSSLIFGIIGIILTIGVGGLIFLLL